MWVFRHMQGATTLRYQIDNDFPWCYCYITLRLLTFTDRNKTIQGGGTVIIIAHYIEITNVVKTQWSTILVGTSHS